MSKPVPPQRRQDRNEIIQDIDLASRDAHGRVQSIATFQITMPETPSQANGLMFYEVANRGGNAIPTAAAPVVAAPHPVLAPQTGAEGTDFICTRYSGVATCPGQPFKRSRIVVPIAAGDSATVTPALRNASILSSAPPLPPAMMAPA
jgi:hypothetical protein